MGYPIVYSVSIAMGVGFYIVTYAKRLMENMED